MKWLLQLGVIVEWCFNEVYGLDHPQNWVYSWFSASYMDYMAQQANFMANLFVVLQFAECFVFRVPQGQAVFQG